MRDLGLFVGLGLADSISTGLEMGGAQLYNARKNIAAINPATLGGVFHHADDLSVGTITSWPNRVSGGNAATSAGVPCSATFGVSTAKCVVFNGTSHAFAQNDCNVVLQNAAGFTMWAILETANNANDNAIIGAIGAGSTLYQLVGDWRSVPALGGVFIRSSTSVAQAGVSTQSIQTAPSKQFIALRVNGSGAASTDVMVNGQLISTLAPRPAKPTGGTIVPTSAFIGSGTGGANFFGGKIRAIGLHPGQLTEDQLIGIQNYLGHMPKKVVCIGNSMTYGQGGTAYPTQLASLLPPNFEVFNLGISGQETLDLDQQPNNGNDYQFAQFGASFLVTWEGTNDLYYQYFSADPNPVTAATLAYSRWCRHVASMRQTRPWARIVTGTVLKRGGAGAATYPVDFEAARVLFNAYLLGGAGGAAGDVVRDWAAYAQFSDTGNATYFADGTHLTTAGYALIAADLNTVLQAL